MRVQQQVSAELKHLENDINSYKAEVEIDAPFPFPRFYVTVKEPDTAGYLKTWFVISMRGLLPGMAAALEQQLKDNMSSSSWGWTDGTRDIVDTGNLRDSQSVQVDGMGFSITNDAEYAALTHYGGYITPYGNGSAEKVYLPARPWITATLEGGGPVPVFNYTFGGL